MELTKPNDILVATLNSPSATSYDLMSNNILGENTSLLSKDQYKSSQFIQDSFKTADGKFDDKTFNDAYNLAQSKYAALTDDEYIKGLDKILYSPFDVTKPKDATVFNVGTIYSTEINPFKELRGWTGIGSINENALSLRELAQQNKVFDPETNTWSTESLNDLGLLDKVFGSTLVYAQYDADGTHYDPSSNITASHKKGDWKLDDNGNLFAEKLGNREVYGKQVVNPMDVLTTDGSLFNSFDIYDSDSREKSIAGTTFKLAAQIAPYLIPGFNTFYGGVNAAIGLSAILPTFYKAFEGILIGDQKSGLTDAATMAEGYLAKFTQHSITDKSQGSMFNYEQLGDMATSVFSQIYEQRAAASLSKFIKSPQQAVINKEIKALTDGINKEFIINSLKTADKIDEVGKTAIYANIMEKIPGLRELREKQSYMAKALNLGYMALTTTGDIYGEALNSGYDRRTAGFAALTAAAGQYGIMMNNRMGDWFLDKTTGYTIESNKALTKKAVTEFLKPISETFKLKSPEATKIALGKLIPKIKDKIVDIFTSPTELGENLFKHSIIEGVEEVTEQLVLDSTKGIIDVMSYLGITKKQGSFGGWDNVFSQAGLENYAANLLGGMIGGPMFELNTTRIEPAINRLLGKTAVDPETRKSIYQLIGNGQTEEFVKEINKQRKSFGNNYIVRSTSDTGENSVSADEAKYSEADVIADNALGIVKQLSGILHSENLVHTNEEIIQKAFVDQMLISKLEQIKGVNKVGIEGLVLNDYTKNIDKLVNIKIQMDSLSTTPEDKLLNKAGIDNLKLEADIYRDRNNNILEGKEAQNYFDKSVLYLTKRISEKFISIDRETFTKNKYNRSYYDLADSGIGINKERINREWEEYKNSTDILENLDVALKVYLDLEQKLNPYIAKQISSNYNQERKKTITNVVDLMGTLSLFNTGENSAQQSLNLFLSTANALEKKTGRKILPWDVIHTNFYDNLLNSGFLLHSDKKTVDPSYLETVLNSNDEGITKKGDILKGFVESVLRSVPSNNIFVPRVAELVNYQIAEYNNNIFNEITKLETAKKELIQNNVPNDQINDLSNQIDILENSILDVVLSENFAGTESQQSKIKKVEEDFSTNIGLQKLDFIREILQTSDISLSIGQIIKDVEGLIKNEKGTIDESDDTKASLLSYISALEFDGKQALIDLLENPIVVGSAVKETYEALKTLNKEITEYSKLRKVADSEIAKITKEQHDLEKGDYLFETLMKELTKGNLDAELVEYLKISFSDSINTLKKSDPNKVFSQEELIVFLEKGTALELTQIEELNNVLYDDFPIKGQLEDAINKITNPIIQSYLLNALQLVPDYNNQQITTLDEEDSNIVLKKVDIIKTVLTSINLFKTTEKNKTNIIQEANKVFQDPSKFISNSIYDFLKDFDVYLNENSKVRVSKLFDILKNQEFSLSTSADASSYLSDGINIFDVKQAIEAIELIKASVYAMSTTTVDLDDPVGFIASRQNFAKNNNTKSDVTNLKTINSDEALLMSEDLERVSNKLKFLQNLLLSNSGQLFAEQESIREKTNTLLLSGWKTLVEKNIIAAGSPIIDDIDSILNNTTLTTEEKLFKIETKFYQKVKSFSIEDKKSIVKQLNIIFPSSTDATNIYNQLGTNEITKHITELSMHDFKLYLMANMVINPKDFNAQLVAILESPDFDKSPFFTQELATKVAYASIISPELFQEITRQPSKTNINTDLITYILGDGGTGKTSVIFKVLTLLLQKNNPNLNIWFSAPHMDQVNRLQTEVLSKLDSSNINKSAYTKIKLFEALGLGEKHKEIIDLKNKAISADNNKDSYYEIDESKFDFTVDLENLPDLIFIDEVTYFGAHELYLLNKLSEKALEAGKYIKIIAAGDISQKGFEIEGISVNVDYVSGIFPARLSLTIRALNNQKRKNSENINALAKFARQNWTESKDDKLILEYVGNGLSLSYVHNNTTLNGDFLTTDSVIPDDVLSTLNTIIKSKPETKISILNDTLELSDEFKARLEKFGISEANYKIYTPSNIQGAEGDYFIFNLSHITGTTLPSKIRDLNTYLTRSKYGTIIVNDKVLPIPLISIKEETSQYITPLAPDVIASNKAERIKILKKLLNNDLTISDDNFKFHSPAIIENPEDIIITSVLTTESTQDKDIKNVGVESEVKQGNVPDDNKFMIHTFYNDINYKVVDGKPIAPNNNSFYGLIGTYLSQEAFEKDVENLISIKYDILGNRKHTKEFTVRGDQTVPVNAIGEFVIKKSKFNKDFNTPYGKQYGNSENILGDNIAYSNLFYKVKSKQGKDVYIHLGTLPSLNTIEFFIKGGKSSNMYASYQKYLISNTDEFIIDPNILTAITSTRLVKSKKVGAARQEFSLQELQKIPGLMFANGLNKFSKTVSYFIYPSTYEAYKELQLSNTFNNPMSEELLKSSFEHNKGKVFVKISFIQSANTASEKNRSQIQFVTLRGSTRSINEIKEAIKNPFNTEEAKSLHDLILSNENSERLKAIKNSLFNGNQVLDLLLHLASKEPALFNSLITSSEEKFKKIVENHRDLSDPILKKFLSGYINVMSKEAEKLGGLSIIDKIAYKSVALKQVYALLINAVADAARSKKPLDVVSLKKEILDYIKKNKLTNWYWNFWNIFSLESQLEGLENQIKGKELIVSASALPELTDFITSTRSLLNDIFKVWDTKLKSEKSGIFFNIPIKGTKGSTELVVDTNAHLLNLENTYIDMAPEGPRFLLEINFSDEIGKSAEINPIVTIVPTTKPVPKPQYTEEDTSQEIEPDTKTETGIDAKNETEAKNEVQEEAEVEEFNNSDQTPEINLEIQERIDSQITNNPFYSWNMDWEKDYVKTGEEGEHIPLSSQYVLAFLEEIEAKVNDLMAIKNDKSVAEYSLAIRSISNSFRALIDEKTQKDIIKFLDYLSKNSSKDRGQLMEFIKIIGEDNFFNSIIEEDSLQDTINELKGILIDLKLSPAENGKFLPMIMYLTRTLITDCK